MNENIEEKVDLFRNTFNEFIDGIIVIKGSGQQKEPGVTRMDIEVNEKDYANKAILLFQTITKMSQRLGKVSLSRIVYEFEDRHLIIGRRMRKGGNVPYLMSLLTKKNVDLQSIEMIYDDLFDILVQQN